MQQTTTACGLPVIPPSPALLSSCFSHDPRRTYDQYEEEHDERDRIRQARADELRAERFDDAVDDAAHQRAFDAAEAAQHANDERFNDERIAHRRVEWIGEAQEHA